MENTPFLERFRTAVRQTIIGYPEVTDQLLAALLLKGHVLLEGVPGVGKTLLAKTVASALGFAFRRIQFTPDMMPTDITGTTIFDFKTGSFHVQQGPIFTDILLADEINRTPPKTQAALLEAMEERQVTLDGRSHRLPSGFFVIATENPIEYEGTYPLPEAQVDRFLMKLVMGYVEPEEEQKIYTLPDTVSAPLSEPVFKAEELERMRGEMEAVHIEPGVLRFLSALVQATRGSARLRLGCSPRGGRFLLRASKACAWMAGRDFVIPDDVKAMAKPVLRHRLLPAPEAQLEGWTTDAVLDELLKSIPATAP